MYTSKLAAAARRSSGGGGETAGRPFNNKAPTVWPTPAGRIMSKKQIVLALTGTALTVLWAAAAYRLLRKPKPASRHSEDSPPASPLPHERRGSVRYQVDLDATFTDALSSLSHDLPASPPSHDWPGPVTLDVALEMTNSLYCG